MHWREIIRRPVITEKSNFLASEFNQYTFVVDPRANKLQIKDAVQNIFNVTVLDVNTINVKPKSKRFGRHQGQTKAWKKAIVLLKEGDRIDFFDGV